jgi:hypothetical protein
MGVAQIAGMAVVRWRWRPALAALAGWVAHLGRSAWWNPRTSSSSRRR